MKSTVKPTKFPCLSERIFKCVFNMTIPFYNDKELVFKKSTLANHEEVKNSFHNRLNLVFIVSTIIRFDPVKIQENMQTDEEHKRETNQRMHN